MIEQTPDYIIRFSAGDRRVHLHINDDLRTEALDRFAARFKPVIEKEEP